MGEMALLTGDPRRDGDRRRTSSATGWTPAVSGRSGGGRRSPSISESSPSGMRAGVSAGNAGHAAAGGGPARRGDRPAQPHPKLLLAGVARRPRRAAASPAQNFCILYAMKDSARPSVPLTARYSALAAGAEPPSPRSTLAPRSSPPPIRRRSSARPFSSRAWLDVERPRRSQRLLFPMRLSRPRRPPRQGRHRLRVRPAPPSRDVSRGAGRLSRLTAAARASHPPPRLGPGRPCRRR